MDSIIPKIPSGLLIVLLLMLSMNGCRQFPGHYIAFQTCLQENTSIGEEFLVAFAELEDFLLREGHLRDNSREAYQTLLSGLTAQTHELRWRDAAPQVRDFWGLQQEGTFGAFPACVQRLSADAAPGEAESLQNLATVYAEMFSPETDSFRTSELLRALTEAVTDDDFGFVLYRAPLLVFIVYLMQ